MAAHIKASEAQQSFSEVMERALSGEDIVIERDGTPQAIVISYERYQHLHAIEIETAHSASRQVSEESGNYATSSTIAWHASTETVEAIFEDGVARPVTHVEGREGQEVTIVFPQQSSIVDRAAYERDWDELERLLDECAIDTGIPDLAAEHDHYLHGTPKRRDRHV